MKDEKRIKCPYCGSEEVYGSDEIRICCIFGHGSKTVKDVNPENYVTLEPCFTCKKCGKWFIAVYELVGVKPL